MNFESWGPHGSVLNITELWIEGWNIFSNIKLHQKVLHRMNNLIHSLSLRSQTLLEGRLRVIKWLSYKMIAKAKISIPGLSNHGLRYDYCIPYGPNVLLGHNIWDHNLWCIVWVMLVMVLEISASTLFPVMNFGSPVDWILSNQVGKMVDHWDISL